MELPEILECPSDGCGVQFRGDYRRGNLNRHRRQKHGGGVYGLTTFFPCEVESCERSFRRKDARLKHYRRHHPHLATIPTLRKEGQSAGVAFEKQDQDLRSVSDLM